MCRVHHHFVEENILGRVPDTLLCMFRNRSLQSLRYNSLLMHHIPHRSHRPYTATGIVESLDLLAMEYIQHFLLRILHLFDLFQIVHTPVGNYTSPRSFLDLLCILKLHIADLKLVFLLRNNYLTPNSSIL